MRQLAFLLLSLSVALIMSDCADAKNRTCRKRAKCDRQICCSAFLRRAAVLQAASRCLSNLVAALLRQNVFHRMPLAA